MKTALISAMLCLLVMPASAADDYSAIPSGIRAKIKSKCVNRYPDDYSMQDGCIMVQSDSYLKVHGGESPPEPTGADLVSIRNVAYLQAARKLCGLEVLKLAEGYEKRALAIPGMDMVTIFRAIREQSKFEEAEGRKHRKVFCAEASKNLSNFAADLKN